MKHLDELDNIANALLEYESISGAEMIQVIKGEPIVRSEAKQKKKRIRRRSKASKIEPSNPKGKQTIITKPAT